MTKSTKQLTLAAAVGALVTITSVWAVSGAPAPEAATTAAPESAAPAVQLSADQVQMQRAAILAAAGRSTLQYADAARQAFAAGQADQGRQYLEVARDTLARINQALQGDGLDPATQVIPLYARVGVMEQVEFSAAQKQRLDDIGPLVSAGRHGEVAASLGELGIAMAYSYVEMPLGRVTSEVSDALAAIEAGDTDAAVAHLQAVADGLVAETVTIGAVESAAESATDTATDAGGAKG